MEINAHVLLMTLKERIKRYPDLSSLPNKVVFVCNNAAVNRGTRDAWFDDYYQMFSSLLL